MVDLPRRIGLPETSAVLKFSQRGFKEVQRFRVLGFRVGLAQVQLRFSSEVQLSEGFCSSRPQAISPRMQPTLHISTPFIGVLPPCLRLGA